MRRFALLFDAVQLTDARQGFQCHGARKRRCNRSNLNIDQARKKYANNGDEKNTPPPRCMYGGVVLYLPDFCASVLLFDVCLFSILENVSC